MGLTTELYKGDHYRVAHGEEEVEALTKKGWSDVLPDGHKYIPLSAHPEQVSLAKKQAAAVAALTGIAPVHVPEPPPSHRPEVVPPSVPMIGAGEEPVKRGPGRPPNPKVD